MEKLSRSPSGDEQGSLDGVLEEVWTWALNFWHNLVRGVGKLYTRQQSF
jgi:hypothetical protein